MGGFDVSPAELQATRGFVDGVAGEIVHQVTSLSLSVDELVGGGWTGSAATDFAKGWREWKEGTREVMKALDGMAILLGMAGRDFEDSDVYVSDQFAKFTR